MKQRITTRKLGEIGEDRTDWARVDAQTEEALAESIRSDPDDEELEPGWIDQAMVLHPSEPKERVTLWLDAEVLNWFRNQGKGYQTRVNAVLRAYYEAVQAKTQAKAKR
jgi:uncharacterized protein (DUF4415 family)